MNIIEDYGLQGAFDGRPLPLGVVGGKMQCVRIPTVSESWEWRKKFRPVLTLRQIADAGFSNDEEKSEAAYQEYIEGVLGLFREFLPAMGCDVDPEQFSVLQLMEAFENVYQMLDPRTAAGLQRTCNIAAARSLFGKEAVAAALGGIPK